MASKTATPATAFEWTVNTLERNTSDGMVQVIHYSIAAHDDAYASSAYGSIGLEPADPDNMVPYADLSAELVLGWLKSALGEEKVTEIEAALQSQINEQRNPTKAAGVPWAV